MYRFIQNIGDYFNPGYFTEDFKEKVFKASGYDSEAIKTFNKRFSGLRKQYYDFKESIIEGNLPMKYVIKHTHDFHTLLLQALGYDTQEAYRDWFWLDDNRVVPVRHILHNGSHPQLLIMEMQPMIDRGDGKTEGLFEQQYNLPDEQDPQPARYRWSNWSLIDDKPIPEGCSISPKVISQALEEIFYLPDDQRPDYVLMLAGNRVFLLQHKQFLRGSYLVFDLEELFSEVSVSANRDYYALFYLLCCKESIAADSQTVLMDRLEDESLRNAYAVTKDLKEGVVNAIEALGNEAIYYIHEVEHRDIDETDDKFEQNVKDDCIQIVYRLLFVFYAEARPELGILPMNNQVYLNGYSLDKLRDLELVDMQRPGTQNGYFIHDSLWRLFTMLHGGYPKHYFQQASTKQGEEGEHFSRTFAVKKIDSPLFDDSKLRALRGVKFRNLVWQKIIRELSISKPDGKHQPGRISYANLGINQLGSVYESILSYRGFYAERDYIEVHKVGETDPQNTFLVPASRMDDFKPEEYCPIGNKKTGKGASADDNNIVNILPKGSFIYRLSGRDRKKSASYYTPEVLTQSTVKYTLKGYVDRLNDPNDSFCAQDLLKLTILEPAMGAASFQNEDINQLAELYITYREKELGKHVPPTERRNEVQKVKAYIATHNVYGVDLNPTAIELGKLSLWLNVIHKDMETPFFSNRLALGNAVIGAWLKVYNREDVIGIVPQSNGHSKVSVNKKPMIPNAWWEKAPHKVKFFKNRVNRLDKEIYHFLLPDKNMLGVLTIAEQKKAHPDEVKYMNKLKKDWIAPISSADFELLVRLSKKIDKLLKDYFDFQRGIDILTNNKTELWGVYGQAEFQYDRADNYDEKQRLNDVRYRHDNAYFRLKMVMDYWCALWFWDYDHADMLPTRSEYWSDIEAMLNVSDEAINKQTRKAVKTYVDNKGQVTLFPEGHMTDMFYQQQLDGYANEPDVAAEPDAGAQTMSQQVSETIVKSKQDYLTETQGKGRTFFDDSKRYQYVKVLADRYHFFHPMLEFLEVFWLRDGFDIICGNPPWIKMEVDIQGIMSEKYPEISIRNIKAAEIRLKYMDRFLNESPDLAKLYKQELIGTSCCIEFMNAYCSYPLLVNQKNNLYKCVLENGFSLLNSNGFMGLLHPEGIYDDPNGQALRIEVYRRLKYHFQFQNELTLFAEVDHHTKYGCNVYSGNSSTVSFDSIHNLFHPSTVDGCYAHDGHGLCSGLKDKNGNWSTESHRNRIIHFTERELRILAATFEGDENLWASTKLVSVHTTEIMNTLEKFASVRTHAGDFEHIIGDGLRENTAVEKGIMERKTRYPDINQYEMIYNGPHFYVSNPYYKTPRSLCKLNSDYDPIALEEIDSAYCPRTNYKPLIPTEEFTSLVDGFFIGQDSNGVAIYDRWIDHYKLVFSAMVGPASERTLAGAIIPPKTTHVHAVISITFKDVCKLLELTGVCSSLPYDFYMKSIGSSSIIPSRLTSFPLGVGDIYKYALFVRTLELNCLTKYYADLWQDQWHDEYAEEQWSIDDPRLKPFSGLKKEWSWDTPLRNYFERRQALVEIDVISAMALGLSLKDLEMIYTIQFPVLQQNENDTWYDQKGNIVFTCSKGLTGVGCDRKEWEEIRGKNLPKPLLKEGMNSQTSNDEEHQEWNIMAYDGNGKPYVHTIDPAKSELYGGQQVTYYPPYKKCDRIADYRRAWAFFEKKFK